MLRKVRPNGCPNRHREPPGFDQQPKLDGQSQVAVLDGHVLLGSPHLRGRLILRHLQDVYERYRQGSADHPVPIFGNMPVPSPLKDLLNAFGTFDINGLRHSVAAPTAPDEPFPEDSFWKLDGQIVRDWVLTAEAIESFSPGLVRTHVFGRSRANFSKRPLMLTVRQCCDGEGKTVTIQTRTVGPGLEDATVRANNDELFEKPYSAEECSIVMYTVNVASSRVAYMRRT